MDMYNLMIMSVTKLSRDEFKMTPEQIEKETRSLEYYYTVRPYTKEVRESQALTQVP